MPQEPLNIITLGGSFARLSSAYCILSHIMPRLGAFQSESKYRVILIGPFNHFYGNPGAPRAIVLLDLIPFESAFITI
ncbi:hypothetical protein K432DRAFT_297324 [Lepidopterella palustris CBS 459.81]|uniref:Uncharacterized protein n=1 Tax=Lepidopterella palustris CBS 459.81 TaxID=1314670 RepID=A0A8E2JFL5_9PEZI|nr:hypothetical protein K432DRAFT_297324 [Lepidopterella palustris CBS 459.81]